MSRTISLVLILTLIISWKVTKADFTFGEPVNLGPMINSSSDDGGTSISADGLTLFFASDRPGGYGSFDLWVATRGTTEDDWGEPTNIGPTVNSSSGEGGPSISADGLSLFFSDVLWELPLPPRPGGYGDGDLWVTTREKINDDWGTPMNLGSTVNSSDNEIMTDISADGRTLFFNVLNRPGGVGSWDICQAPVIPMVDFNGDGIVDSADMCMMIDHWGEDYSLCDIGPMPWGDGVVDVEDLIVIAEHLFEEIPQAER